MSRRGVLQLTVAGVALVAAHAVMHPSPALVWNASASAPPGLYRVKTGDTLRVGDLVVVQPPTGLANAFAKRGYLPVGVPLLKHVSALGGQMVCRHGADITVNGRIAVRALANDRRGRPLPVWSGCIGLRDDQVFVLNPAIHDSLDGRYFGALPTSTVIGRATPLWLSAAR